MRPLIIILSVILLASCSTSKKVVQQQPAENVEVVIDDNTYPLETELNTIDEQMEEVDPDAAAAELTIDDTPPPPMNDMTISWEETREIPVEAFNHSRWDDLLKQYVSEDGRVDYSGFKNEVNILRTYINSMGENLPTNDWTREDKLAYWINAYNAMTVDLIVRNLPLQSIKDIKDPWKQRLWKLGDKWYNLDEIEHQILRKMNEPRIHFGIVCASFSCPKLLNEAFTANNLEEQLSSATKGFLADPKRNIIQKDEIKLSKIFQWFAKDFKQDGSLIDFLNAYTEIEISDKARKKFLDYNWDLND